MSIMAGVTIDTLSRDLGAQRVIRCVPNTPARIGRGVTAYVASPACTAEDRKLIEQLLEPLGTVEPIAAERLMDVVTAVSGSGPAYVFLLAEVLAAAAEQEGLDRDTAMRLASRTVAGAGALMLETGRQPKHAAQAGELARRHHRSGARRAEHRRRPGAAPAPRCERGGGKVAGVGQGLSAIGQ